MTMFSINKSALDALKAAPVENSVTICDELRTSRVCTNSVSYNGMTPQSATYREALMPVRAALLSFEEDWNAAGMEAYDAL